VTDESAATRARATGTVAAEPSSALEVSALEVTDLSKSYGATRALSEVSFAVTAGRVHALLGGNGSGKSTLVKVLAGVVRAAPGGVVTTRSAAGTSVIAADDLSAAAARAAGLRFVHQEPSVFPELSVAENLAIGDEFSTDLVGRIRWRVLRQRAASVIDQFAIAARPAQIVRTLRPVEQTLLAVARALRDPGERGTKILVLDEPTAALPYLEATRLLGTLSRLAADGHSIVLVSHRLDEIRDVADEFTVLRDGQHVLTAALGSHSTADLAELIVGHEIAPPERPAAAATAPRDVLTVRGLHAGPLAGIGLSVAAGEIVGVAGLSGSGCSTLLRTVAGDRAPAHGQVLVDGRPLPPGDLPRVRSAGVVLIPQQRSQIAFADMPVAMNLTIARARRYWRRGFMSARKERDDAELALRNFKIVASSSRAAMSSLSGGNQQKVILAAALESRPRVLLLDDPTQGVDIGSRQAIHGLIREAAAAGTCVLVASSDLDELADLCDRVLVLNRGSLTAEFSGERLTQRALLQAIHADNSPERDRSR
jgi:ribose transport system ATP-binding protein